jgi:hypothetical protein
MSAQAEPQNATKTITQGVNLTDTETDSFTKSIGAEGGAAGKGLSLKLSASLSQTHTEEHSISISNQTTVERSFHCPAHTTVQVWQLVAIFTHQELIPGDIDVGFSIDWWEPPYNPGDPPGSPRVLRIPTEMTVSKSFPIGE